MIAKVAEMHALRMACPEEMAQIYVEEEKEAETIVISDEDKVAIQIEAKTSELDIPFYEKKLEATKDYDSLRAVWASLPAEAKLVPTLVTLKDTLKAKHEDAIIHG